LFTTADHLTVLDAWRAPLNGLDLEELPQTVAAQLPAAVGCM
jgi:hypothetical protein